MDYTTLVFLTCLTAVGSTEINKAVKHQTTPQQTYPPIIAGFALGVFLFIFGMANEGLGARFCILIIAGSLLINGIPLFTSVTTALKSSQTTPTK